MKLTRTLLLGALLLAALGAQADERRGFIRAANCVLRCQPDDKAPAVVDVPLDTEVTVLESIVTDNVTRGLWWFRVQHRGQAGWTRGSYLFIIRDPLPLRERLQSAGQAAVPTPERRFVLEPGQEIASELKLHADGNFDSALDVCSGLLPVRGRYTATEETIVLHDFAPQNPVQSRVRRAILDWLQVELAWTARGDLEVLTDTSYDAGTETYGLCAPRRGQVLRALDAKGGR
jgi:hypothetical protein